MSDAAEKARLIARRNELMTELFLDDLDPAWVAHSTQSSGYDYLLAIPNSLGGANLAAVRTHATEGPVREARRVTRRLYRWMAHSNIPVLLVVNDVMHRKTYFALMDGGCGEPSKERVSVRLTEVDEHTLPALRARLAAAPAPAQELARAG